MRLVCFVRTISCLFIQYKVKRLRVHHIIFVLTKACQESHYLTSKVFAKVLYERFQQCSEQNNEQTLQWNTSEYGKFNCLLPLSILTRRTYLEKLYLLKKQYISQKFVYILSSHINKKFGPLSE